jgi:lysophospholipase L1-like esterase
MSLPAVVALTLAAFAMAADQAANPLLTPTPRKDEFWQRRHKALAERAQKGDVDLLFLGDSITQGWEGMGREVWQQHFAPQHAANFGIGGDGVPQVLWRITDGRELVGIKPKVIVVLIGTNNTSSPTEQIVEGVAAIVRTLRERLPETRILLLGLLPRGTKRDDAIREQIRRINMALAKLDDGSAVRYADIGPSFLDAKGGLPREVMYDGVHPTAKGYALWAEAIKAPLKELMK